MRERKHKTRSTIIFLSSSAFLLSATSIPQTHAEEKTLTTGQTTSQTTGQTTGQRTINPPLAPSITTPSIVTPRITPTRKQNKQTLEKPDTIKNIWSTVASSIVTIIDTILSFFSPLLRIIDTRMLLLRNPFRGISPGLTVQKIGDIIGQGKTQHFGLGVADLGQMVNVGPHNEFAIIFGDSFKGLRFGEGQWLSPVGFIAELDANQHITIKRPINDDQEVKQLIDYQHIDFLTLIPSDIININGTLYLQGSWNKGIGNVLRTQIWSSTDNGTTWSSLSHTDPHFMNGMGQLLTWERGDDGFVYIMSTKFNRKEKVYLSRVRETHIADTSQWQHFNPSLNTWSTTLTPVLSTAVQAGELSLRKIQNHWVLSMFNAQTAAIEIRISKNITVDWNNLAVARAITQGIGGWSAHQTPHNFTQLYGGYITPGSTLSRMILVVSQWNTKDNSRYTSTQFTVEGLDTFFHIHPS